MTRIEKNGLESKSSLKAKYKVERIFQSSKVSFFASGGRFKFICTECIVQELNMLLNISPWNLFIIIIIIIIIKYSCNSSQYIHGFNVLNQSHTN